jgi:hypothetical protein
MARRAAVNFASGVNGKKTRDSGHGQSIGLQTIYTELG